MKWLIVSGGVLLAAALVVIFAWPQPRHGAIELIYGRDTCDRCRMKITRAGFAAELRDAQGNLTRYDDIGCMILKMHEAHREFPEAWVEDRGGSGFVPLLKAFLVRGDLDTPMRYGVVAFTSENVASEFARENKAEVVPLEVLLKDRERFTRKEPNR